MMSLDLSVEEATRDLSVWAVRLERGSARQFLELVTAKAADEGTDFLVVEADMVFGEDHLRSALYHAKRALSDGRNVSGSLAMETLLYASGERQLSAAIRKMSVTDETTEVVVARLQGGAQGEAGWERMPDAPREPSHERLVRFGITARELSTMEGHPADLVLERVAAVDVLKK